jgi:hypothetical protein
MPRKRKRSVSVETLLQRKKVAQRIRRSNPDIRAQEQAAQRIRRSNPAIRAKEQAADTIFRRIRRSNPDIRAQEQAAQRIRRSNPAIRAEEQAQDTIARCTRRSNPDYGAKEQANNTVVKADHNINGITAYNVYSLRMVTSKNISVKALNMLRIKLANVQVTFMNEISMMGKRTFDDINKRLCKIFLANRSFVTVSIHNAAYSVYKEIGNKYLEMGIKNKDQAKIMSPIPLSDETEDEDLNKSINSVKEIQTNDKDEIMS